jgi:hypothetical protein
MDCIAAIQAEIVRSDEKALWAYLSGASHDGTISRLHGTLRISQRDRSWLEMLTEITDRLGYKSWIYREGSRNVWVLETSIKIPSQKPIGSPDFVRGFFDAEGGTPQKPDARFYVQLVQKDRALLAGIRGTLTRSGIECGRLHNPSVRVDPDYWRFFVRACSWATFTDKVGSWHPRKRSIIDQRFPPRSREGGASPGPW